MELVWTLLKEREEIEIKIIYNIYFKKGKIEVNGKKIKDLKNLTSQNPIVFQYDNEEYKVVLTPKEYDYMGELITKEGEKILGMNKQKNYKKLPLWVVVFIVIDFSIPIISVEAVTPWVIAIISSYLTAKATKKLEGQKKYKVAAAALFSVIAWGAYYAFYLSVKSIGMHGGFLSIK